MPRFKILELNSIKFIRVIEMRKDMFFGRILRNDKKLLKKFDLTTNSSIAVQFLESPENLEENDIVLLLRRRVVSSRSYTDYQEYIFKAPNAPTISELKKGIIQYKQLNVEEDGIELSKYYPREFNWKHIHKKYIEEENKNKKSKNNKNKKGKKGNNSIKIIENYLIFTFF